MDRVENLMKEFTEAGGVSGFEEEICALMKKSLDPIAETERDRLGSFISVLKGRVERPRVMLVAHMDEIGLMVSHFTGAFIRFNALGGWWSPRLIGLPVRIRTSRGEIRGVVSGKSPYHMEKDEREKPIRIKDLFIDVGLPAKRSPGDIGIRPGDPVVPDFPFAVLHGGKTYMAKAWDNRLGCLIVVEAMHRLAKSRLPNTVFGVGTVQEEVGLRGAVTSSRRINPDVCFALDVNIAQDIPGSPEGSMERLGAGVSICVYDATLIPNTRLRDHVVAVAGKKKIPHHFSAVPYGGTDGGRVHLNEYGVPTIVLGVPTRYIHSGAGIIKREDFESAVKLVVEVVKTLDAKTVEALA